MSLVKSNNKGFSLIELAIVMVIAGLFLSGALSFWTKFNDNRIASEMDRKIELIKLSLGAYVFDEPDNESDPIRFPCPAPLNISSSDKDYGHERCPWKEKDKDNERMLKFMKAGDDTGGVYVLESLGDKPIDSLKGSYNVSKNKEFVLIGAVPASTLQIPMDNMVDPYGNLFLYAVTLSLTKDGALLVKPGIHGAIKVVDGYDRDITNNARFFLFSSGKDGAGGYSKNGSKLPTLCRNTYSGDALNCNWQKNSSAVFRQQEGFSHGNTDEYYDDTATFRMFSQKDLIGWWQSLDTEGKNITTKNAGAVIIGNVDHETLQEEDKLFVDGNVKAKRIVILPESNNGDDEDTDNEISDDCAEEVTGSLRYNEGKLQFCDGDSWKNIKIGGFGCTGNQVLKGVGDNGVPACVELPPAP